MSYNYLGNNISTYIAGISNANYGSFSNAFKNSNIISVSNDLGINDISVVPTASLNYIISGTDIYNYAIAKYDDDKSITQENIPSWCNHLRVVMVSSGNNTIYYNNVTTHETAKVNNQDIDMDEFNIHSHQHVVDTVYSYQHYFQTTLLQEHIPAPTWDRNGSQGNFTSHQTVGTAYYSPGAGAFTFVDIKKANLQTLQISSNTININTYGIQLSNGTASSSGANGANGTVSFQNVPSSGADYSVPNLFRGRKYSSGTLGQCGIKVFDGTASRNSGDTSSSSNGFFRIYYLAS